MKPVFQNYSFTWEQINRRIDDLFHPLADENPPPVVLRRLVGCIDLTTLEGSDTHQRIIGLCEKAKRLIDHDRHIPPVAGVCVYSPFVAVAKKALEATGIRVTCAAGGFPSGQLPLELKLEEIRFAIEQGTDEIDTVISRGKLLEGNEHEVYDELAAIRELCADVRLKVILETGELESVNMIRRASEIAILAGADMIKTSTGKIQPAATEQAMLIMLDTISEYATATGRLIGVKPAGGIQLSHQAYRYYRLVHDILGDPWLNPELFRIGASRLLDNLLINL